MVPASISGSLVQHLRLLPVLMSPLWHVSHTWAVPKQYHFWFSPADLSWSPVAVSWWDLSVICQDLSLSDVMTCWTPPWALHLGEILSGGMPNF